MPEQQDPDDTRHDGPDPGGRQQPPRPPAAGRRPEQADPDATQLIDRPSGTWPRQAEEEEQRTQILGAQSGQGPIPPTRLQHQQPQRGSAGQSFGGTFPSPPAPGPQTTGSSGPRFATPTQPPRGGSVPPHPPRAATAPARPAPPRRPRRRNWWVRGILVLVVAWLLFLVAVPIWAWQHITKVDAEPGGQRPSATAGTTYLLVGSDSRQGLTAQQEADLGTGAAAGQRTDTIILLHVPDNSGPNLLLSIPRDSAVDVPGHGQQKINSAYAFGGPELLVQTVEQATGVRVDDYVEVGFTGFVDIVDAVGGIQVCPTEPIDDPKAGNLKMSKGCHEVDGHTALDYSRSRAFALGDITRAEHQREVITAVGAKAASWQTFALPWRYLQVNRAAAASLRIGQNVGPLDLAQFAWAMAHTGGANAKRCVVPYTSLGTSTSAGSVVTWDPQQAAALFGAIRDDNTASISCSATGQ